MRKLLILVTCYVSFIGMVTLQRRQIFDNDRVEVFSHRTGPGDVAHDVHGPRVIVEVETGRAWWGEDNGPTSAAMPPPPPHPTFVTVYPQPAKSAAAPIGPYAAQPGGATFPG